MANQVVEDDDCTARSDTISKKLPSHRSNQQERFSFWHRRQPSHLGPLGTGSRRQDQWSSQRSTSDKDERDWTLNRFFIPASPRWTTTICNPFKLRESILLSASVKVDKSSGRVLPRMLAASSMRFPCWYMGQMAVSQFKYSLPEIR